MCISLIHIGVISTIHKRHATLGFNQLYTGKNIHRKYETKKIYQIFIYTTDTLRLAFPNTVLSKTAR
jgi:hypothetical protein